MTRRARTCLAAATLLAILAAPAAGAEVLTGFIDGLPESMETFFWGDGEHDLYQQWSVRQ